MLRAAPLLVALAATPAKSEDLAAVFEDALFLWVASSTRLDLCASSARTPQEASRILDDAEAAFHPHVLDWLGRRQFRDDMSFMAEKGAAQGKLDYREKGCFEVDLIERVGRQTVEDIIQHQARRR